jgi:hypothetical protein
MSPVALAGFVKNRRHQFGRQASFGTRVAAKRAYAMKGVPTVNPNWVDPDVDVGSIDWVVAPHREAPSYTATLNFPQLHYNDLCLILSGFFGGGVDPTGVTAKTWLWTPASTTVDDVDPFTYEFGDDVTTYWDQLSDGIIESFEITFPEGKGAATASTTWRFGAAHGSGFSDFTDSPTVPTALSVTPNETVVYGKDLGLYIASDLYDALYEPGALVANALHTCTLRGSREIDEKRYLDGDGTFDVDAFATAARTIELEAQWAKTSDIVGEGSETDAWFSNQAVDRYIRLFAESSEEADTGVPYSWDSSMPMRYYTSEHTDSGGNATETLTAKAFYDPVNSVPVYTGEVVNTLAAAGF